MMKTPNNCNDCNNLSGREHSVWLYGRKTKEIKRKVDVDTQQDNFFYDI